MSLMEGKKYDISKLKEMLNKNASFLEISSTLGIKQETLKNILEKNGINYTKNDNSHSRKTIPTTDYLENKHPIFTHIGNFLNVSDKTVAKMCKRFSLPSKIKDLKTFLREN